MLSLSFISYIYSCKMSTFPIFSHWTKKKLWPRGEESSQFGIQEEKLRNQPTAGGTLKSGIISGGKSSENAATQQNVTLGRLTALLKGSGGASLWVPTETLVINCYYERNDSLWCIRCSLSNFILMTIFFIQYAEPECLAAEISLIIPQNTHTCASTTSVVV